jgi:hypothetical protein
MSDVAKVVIKKIIADRDTYLHKREWNNAHLAGATCARELTYWRLKPEWALPNDPELELFFAHGKWVEKEANAQLEKAGYEVYERDRPYEWPKMRLSGRIDGKIRENGEKIPIEIKGYAPWVWSKLNTIDDFFKSDIEYLRRVPGQLLSYVLMGNSQRGILYLVNKLSGKPKTIMLTANDSTLEWGEKMLKKLERVNRAVRREVPPERIPYDESVCGVCRFRHKCLTEIKPAKGLKVLKGAKAEELLELLDERDRLAKAHRDYEKADAEVSRIVEGRTKLVVGDWLVTGQVVKVGKQIRKPYTFWRKSIVDMTKQKSDE